MSNSALNEYEIVYNLRHAKNLRRQIYIEAQLNDVPYEVIRDIALKHGLIIKKPHVIDYSQVKALYESGKSDREVAAALGISKCTVCHWRNRNGLKPNSHIDYSQIQALYYAGLSDKEISQTLHISQSTVRYWRYKNGVTPNKFHGG